MDTDNVRLSGKTRRYRRTIKATRLSHRGCVAVLLQGHARASDIIEHTTFVHEPLKLRPGHESNALAAVVCRA